MNFLDAHKLVYDYINIFTKYFKKGTLGFYPRSALPTQDKDTIIDAYKIFLAHTIYYNSRKQEEIEVFFNLVSPLNFFISDNTYEYIIECISLDKDEKKHYANFCIELARCPYRYRELLDYYNRMVKINDISKNDYVIGESIAVDFIYDYCKKAYENADIEFRDEYFYYFLSFSMMRNYVSTNQYGEYYNRYKEYILTNE